MYDRLYELFKKIKDNIATQEEKSEFDLLLQSQCMVIPERMKLLEEQYNKEKE